MKYYKFEKITKGNHPIIRITYKNCWGNLVIKDICKRGIDSIGSRWVFMENGDLVFNCEPIDNFFYNNKDIYFVNGF